MSGGFARPLAPRRGTSPVRHGSEESSTGLSQPFAGLKLASTAEGSQALFAPSLSLIPSEPSVASSAQAPAPAARIVSLSEDSSGHSQALASPRRVTPATEDLQRYASGSMDGSGYGLSKAPPMPEGLGPVLYIYTLYKNFILDGREIFRVRGACVKAWNLSRRCGGQHFDRQRSRFGARRSAP